MEIKATAEVDDLENSLPDLSNFCKGRKRPDMSGIRKAKVLDATPRQDKNGNEYVHVECELTTEPGMGWKYSLNYFDTLAFAGFLRTVGVDPATFEPRTGVRELRGKEVCVRMEGEKREAVGGQTETTYKLVEILPFEASTPDEAAVGE